MSDSKAVSQVPTPDSWLVHVTEGKATRLKDELLGSADTVEAEILVLRGDMTFGPDHIASAAYHARKAFDEGRNSSDSLAMETLLYASGERQLSSAIAKMGVDDRTSEIVVVRLSGDAFVPGDGWTPLAEAGSETTQERLLRFGISREELSTVPMERWRDLVLERVAVVDLIKR